MPRPEAVLSLAIRRALAYAGALVWSTEDKRGGATGVTPGIPDLWVVDPKRKRCAWMEIKTPKGRVTGAQEQFLAEARTAGVDAFVVRSVADALAWLERPGLTANDGPARPSERSVQCPMSNRSDDQ